MHVAARTRRPTGGGEHLAHVAMLLATAFMLATMPPARGALTGPHAAHLQFALGLGPGSPTGLFTTLCFAALVALGFERIVTVILLRASVPSAKGTWLQWWLQHPAGLPGCDAVMCAVMAAMLGPML